MTTSKDAEPGIRTTRESEIFSDPPGSGNYSSSIGAAQGIELFSGTTVIDTRVAPVTVTAAVPDMVPEVTVMVELPDARA